MTARIIAVRIAAASLCGLLLACRAAGPTQQAQDQAALLLKKNQTVAGTERDSGECQKKAGLPEAEPTQPRSQSDVEIALEPGRQYALAGWVPVLIQSVGQGIGQGLGEARRESLSPEAKKQAEQLAAYQSCMTDKGYIVAHVTTEEYHEVELKANVAAKEAALRALHARYDGTKPPGVGMTAPAAIPGRPDSSSNQKPGK